MNCIKEDNAIKYEFQVFVNKAKQHGTAAANGVADGATAVQHEEYQYLIGLYEAPILSCNAIPQMVEFCELNLGNPE